MSIFQKLTCHMLKRTLTEFVRASHGNILLSVLMHEPLRAQYLRHVRHDFETNIFPSGLPTQ